MSRLAINNAQLQARVDYCVVTMLSRTHSARLEVLAKWRGVQQASRKHKALLSAEDLDTDMSQDLITPMTDLKHSLPASIDDTIDECFHSWQQPWGMYFGSPCPDWLVQPPERMALNDVSLRDTMESFVQAVASYDRRITFPFGHTPDAMTPAVANLLEEAVRKNPNL